jgi:tetratricopeptide (TPR) repeat protein
MTPEDKRQAREALEKGLLKIDQVQTLLAEADRTGRPFAAVAREKGLLAPPPPPPPAPPTPPPARTRPAPYPVLLGASLLILAALLVATIIYRFDRSRKDLALEEETARSRLETERKVLETKIAYDRRRLAEIEASARAALERARAALAWIDLRIGQDPADPTIHDRAMEAKLAADLFLEAFPEDAPALALRSRAWELRRNYDEALRDLERALSLKPDLEPAERRRLELLRRLNTRPGARPPG